MNKLFALILITIAFIGCDGKYRAHMTNEDVLREANLLESFSEQLKYIPEQPTEIITDTILSNGFNIKTTYHSIENSYVLKKIKNKDGTSINTYHSNFEVQFQFHKNKMPILEGIINKELFYEQKSHSFWQHAVMQYVWVDYESMTEKSIQLNTSFNIPETTIFKDFSIILFENGEIRIKEINLKNNNT